MAAKKTIAEGLLIGLREALWHVADDIKSENTKKRCAKPILVGKTRKSRMKNKRSIAKSNKD